MLGESVEEDAQQNAERLEYLATMMLQFSESVSICRKGRRYCTV